MAFPDVLPAPTIVVIQEIFGVNADILQSNSAIDSVLYERISAEIGDERLGMSGELLSP